MVRWEQEYGRYNLRGVRHAVAVKAAAPRGILFPGDPGVPDKTNRGRLEHYAPRVGMAGTSTAMAKPCSAAVTGIYYTPSAELRCRCRGAMDRHGAIVQRTHRRSVRSLNRPGAAVRRSHLGRIRLRADHRGTRAELPAGTRCRSKLRLQRLEMATTDRPSPERRSSDSSRMIHGRASRMSAGAATSWKGHRHFNPGRSSFNSPRTGLALRRERPRARAL